jgi:hypothetical protein
MMMVMKFWVDVKGGGKSNSTLAKEKTPVFEGAYEKLRQQWPEFVAFKASERAKEMSEKIRQMLTRRHITIFWGQTATRV